MNKWRSLAQDGHPPVGTVCAYGADDRNDDPSINELWAKGDKVEILAYLDDYAVIYNRTREAADIRNLDYGDEGPVVVALDEASNPKEWNGEGLPPTGTVCEMLHPGISEYGWQRVEIKAYFDDRVVVSGSPAIWGGGFGAIHINSKLKFRPIRSEEDQAVEEIAKILQNDHQIVTDTHSKNLDYFIGPARALYRSGYSKKEKK
jgi:hypothetical protein